MKTTFILLFISFISLLLISCESLKGTGTLKLKTFNPLSSQQSVKQLNVTENQPSYLQEVYKTIDGDNNPPLANHSTSAITSSLMFCVGDIWVSKDEVKAGNPDNLEWVRLTATTNRNHKLFENYVFSSVEIPTGNYKSIKLTFRNVFYRHLQLLSDPAVSYDLLETMGSWTDGCDPNDTTWVKPNYFGPGGNHKLNDNTQKFELVSEGEKLGGFTIEDGKTAFVTWRLGAGATEPCTTLLIDENDNHQWDCGTDRMNFECPPSNKYMWDFVVEYK